jgi:hypothetical protein
MESTLIRGQCAHKQAYVHEDEHLGWGMSGDKYVCAYCGVEFSWNKEENDACSVYVCGNDNCGAHICFNCLNEMIPNVKDYLENEDNLLCPDCNERQIKEKHVEKLFIRVKGGMVQEVYSSNPDVDLTILDEDSDVESVDEVLDNLDIPEYQIY